VLSLGFSF